MKYPDSQDAHLGDKVRLGRDEQGIVVCSIDAGEYSADYPEEQWGYLQRGVLINFPQSGLIHYEEADSDLSLIKRAEI